MYTNTSKFRIRGKYGLFTIPKGILGEAGWKPRDLIGFWGIDGKVIHMEKIGKKQRTKFGKDYNKKVYKKIAKFGGKTGTYGIKSIPEFLMKEFKPKDGQTIYFLPAKYTWLKDYYSDSILDNVIFVAFNFKYLKRFDESIQKTKEELDKEYKEYFKKEFKLNFFNKRLEISDKNSERTRNKLKRKNETIHKNKVLGLEDLIEKLKKWKKEVQSSEHPKKKDIVKELNKRIKEVQSEKEKVVKDKTPMFKTLSKENIADSIKKNMKDKINRIEKINRRYNE